MLKKEKVNLLIEMDFIIFYLKDFVEGKGEIEEVSFHC
jgi:hypothetical protein